jgi:RHS repeat-associated protein
MEGHGTPILSENQYQYNGKELNADFGLDLYDYGARWYDASVGRWHGVDPLAEAYLTHSPYNHVRNNPISRFDPNGMNDVESMVRQAWNSTPEGTNSKTTYHSPNDDSSNPRFSITETIEVKAGYLDSKNVDGGLKEEVTIHKISIRHEFEVGVDDDGNIKFTLVDFYAYDNTNSFAGAPVIQVEIIDQVNTSSDTEKGMGITNTRVMVRFTGIAYEKNVGGSLEFQIASVSKDETRIIPAGQATVIFKSKFHQKSVSSGGYLGVVLYRKSSVESLTGLTRIRLASGATDLVSPRLEFQKRKGTTVVDYSDYRGKLVNRIESPTLYQGFILEASGQ